jgi:hypothetical protein
MWCTSHKEEIAEALEAFENQSALQQARAAKAVAGFIAALTMIAANPLSASSATRAFEAICKYRGELLQKGSCQCGEGNIWACALIGQQIGRACGLGKCNKYEASP